VHKQTIKEKAHDIGDEVEAFSIAVNQWEKRRRHISEDDYDQRFDAAKNLLKSLQKVVQRKYEDIVTQSDFEPPLTASYRGRIESLQTSRGANTAVVVQESANEANSLADLRKRKAELDSWDLLNAVTDLHRAQQSFPSAAQPQGAQSPFKVNNRSASADLWGQFVLENAPDRERKCILEWLERTAQTSETSFESIVEEMESRTGTGSGTWSHGWLYTREKVKGEKRLRDATSLRQSTTKSPNSSEALVTQLDPDAPTRQQFALEKQDEHYERSLWLACYEMVRRGLPWNEVREWFEARNETWRAASLGAAQDLGREQSRICLGGPYVGALWRRMCFEASQHTSADKYERAVYGLLAGDIKSVEPVCKSWQDYVYVHYNSLLLGSFEAWLQQNHEDRLPSKFTQKFPLYQPLDPSEDYRKQIMDNVLKRPEFSPDKDQGISYIQAILIAGTFEAMVEHVGNAIAASAAEGRAQMTHQPPRPSVVRINYEEFGMNWNVLRIVVHMVIVFREAGLELDEHLTEHVENIMVAYMDILRLMGKIDAIPTYALFLPEPYQWWAMGRILFDVTNHSEQDQLVRLMGEAGLNVREILSDQFIHACYRLGLQPGQGKSIGRFEIVEAAGDRWAGWRVKEDLKMPENDDFLSFITEDQTRAVRALQWFFRCNSTWKTSFFGITFVMKQLLRVLFSSYLNSNAFANLNRNWCLPRCPYYHQMRSRQANVFAKERKTAWKGCQRVES
jgi:nuclear pore complex protein Nup107